MSDLHHSIPVITVDGPTGSGKGTVCRLLAERLGWHLLDSGAIYRVLALASLQQHIPADNAQALAKLASKLHIEFSSDAHGESQVLLHGQEITAEIRREEVGNQASKISRHPEVRSALMDCQRAFNRFPGLVADGRDMGTIVFPAAELKVFLWASAEERAKRRYLQLHANGLNADLNTILAELNERDLRDESRSIAPLKPAKGAELLDSTQMGIEQVVNHILDLARKRFSLPG